MVVAGVPLLRPQEADTKRFTKSYSAKSRPAEESETAEVAVSGGVSRNRETGALDDECSRRFDSKDSRAAWAEIGVVARYDKWLNPRESTSSFATVPKNDGTKTTKTVSANSRAVDASGRPPKAVDAQPAGEGSAVVTAGKELRSNAKAFDLLRAGLDLFKARDYGKARDALCKASPLAPTNGIPHFHAALALFALGEYDAAAWDLRRGLDLLPDFARLSSDIRSLYGDATDLEDQTRALESYTRLHPTDAEALALLGYIRFASGNAADAEPLFSALAQARPDDALPAFMLDVMRPPAR